MTYIDPKRSVLDMVYSMIEKHMVKKPLLGCRQRNCRTHKVNTTEMRSPSKQK
jgi:hypothetical protein